MAIYAVAIPKWGIEMERGTVSNWHSAVGDVVAKGDELVDLESDKIVNTLEATGDGMLRRQFAEVDDELVVGALIGIIADADVSDEEIDAFIADYSVNVGDNSDPENKAETVSEQSDVMAKPSAPSAAKPGGKVRVSTPVRRHAEKLGVDLDHVIGSGPNGRISKEDVDKVAQGGSSAAAQPSEPPTNFSTTKLSATQQTISRRLQKSKQTIPHFYLSTDIELDALLAKRAELNESQEQKISVNDMLVWCVAKALLKVPGVNAQLVGDEIRHFSQADISVAVATERGLITPVIQAADTLTPAQISTHTKALVEKAKNGKLERDEIHGGSFTVSNLGMFGVKKFDAIINPPQVAILALGQAQQQMIVRDDKPAVASILSVSLSCDHRVVDGALGGEFLSVLKDTIESLG